MRYTDIPGVGRLSRLVLGTLAFDTERMDQARELLDAFVGMGGNAVDTAYIYGGGKAERALGQWLRDRGARDRVILVDKGCHPLGPSGPRVNAEALDHDLREGLQRLGTECIDLYLLHRDDPSRPAGEIVEALDAHRRAGRIRGYGASNWTHQRIGEANAYARAHGLAGFVCSSPNLSLARPLQPRWPGCVSVDAEASAWYARTRLPVLSWSSQAGGFFTERFAPERTDNAEMVRTYYSVENWERKRRAERLGRERGATANQVALAWVLHQPFPTLPLIGPWSVAELASSAAAERIALSPSEVAWLDLRQEWRWGAPRPLSPLPVPYPSTPTPK